MQSSHPFCPMAAQYLGGTMVALAIDPRLTLPRCSMMLLALSSTPPCGGSRRSVFISSSNVPLGLNIATGSDCQHVHIMYSTYAKYHYSRRLVVNTSGPFVNLTFQPEEHPEHLHYMCFSDLESSSIHPPGGLNGCQSDTRGHNDQEDPSPVNSFLL